MKPKLLLHICCAPCAIIPVQHFAEEYDITLLYYNPNIHPYKEYLDRLDSVKLLADENQLPLLVETYEDTVFLKNVIDHPEEPFRCKECYGIRLLKLDEISNKTEIPFVSTTLLYSIYQKHELIREVASQVIRHATFLYQDFRPQFWEGVQQAKEKNYYRQKYCGCLFSNYDRYNKK